MKFVIRLQYEYVPVAVDLFQCENVTLVHYASNGLVVVCNQYVSGTADLGVKWKKFLELSREDFT